MVKQCGLNKRCFYIRLTCIT